MKALNVGHEREFICANCELSMLNYGWELLDSYISRNWRMKCPKNGFRRTRRRSYYWGVKVLWALCSKHYGNNKPWEFPKWNPRYIFVSWNLMSHLWRYAHMFGCCCKVYFKFSSHSTYIGENFDINIKFQDIKVK